MENNSFMLYGANGYTGKLIARLASSYGLMPILAGRNAAQLSALAGELHYPYRVIDLDKPVELRAALKDITVVIHAAGPFDVTAQQMVTACIETRTHYLDINGDISVFEMIKKFDAAAKEAGVMLMPGVGFDVVPTDCLALYLKKRMPDAQSLKLAFATPGGGLSHGTALTMAGSLGRGGLARKQGQLTRRPLGEKSLWVDFGEKKIFVMTIPWGDVSTAYTTTGIPDIETYTGISPKVFWLLKLQGLYNWVLRTSFVRKMVIRKINQRPAGPGSEQRQKATSLVWGEVRNEKNEIATARLSGPEGYTLTAHSSLLIVQKVLQGNCQPGYQTPAKVYGEDLVLEIPGVKRW